MAPPSITHNWLGKVDIAVQTVLLVIALLATGLRLWSRRLQRIASQGNDWLIVAAMVRSIINSSSMPILGYADNDLSGLDDWPLCGGNHSGLALRDGPTRCRGRAHRRTGGTC